MRAVCLPVAVCCLLALAPLAGCGGGSGATATEPGTAESRSAPPAGAFPDPFGRSLREVMQLTDKPAEVVVSPEAMVFDAGENRYPFGIFRGEEEVTDAEVAIYFSRVPPVEEGARSKPGVKGQAIKAQDEALDEEAIGPFPASIESIEAEPAFRADPDAEGPEPGSVVYAAEVDFPADGEWRMGAIIREGEETSSRLLPIVSVGEFTQVPRVGQQAPKIDTPTAEEVGGDLSKITTREPPDTQNQVDYADALGKEPIVLLFATPKFCQSRVCGPVVDVAEQANEEYGDEAAFIHMEIYKENDPDQATRPQVRRFHLPTEPWLYAIDRQGTIRAAVEGAFGPELMDEAVQAAVGR
ncbi:MAG: hypothetical protein R2725_12340 [Solirubrobacterales bacterium]